MRRLRSKSFDALFEWIGPRPRPYREVIDAWRTSCPRLPVCEEANDRGLLDHHHAQGGQKHCNARRTLHGGILATLADVALATLVVRYGSHTFPSGRGGEAVRK